METLSIYEDGDIVVTPPSLLSQPLWVTCPATPEASPTWPRWTLTCLSMSAPACASPPASCRLFHSVQVWGGLWSTSPHCAPCSPSAPGCCTAQARLPERWCSGYWQKRSRTCGCSTTLQVRNCLFVLVTLKSNQWIGWTWGGHWWEYITVFLVCYFLFHHLIPFNSVPYFTQTILIWSLGFSFSLSISGASGALRQLLT